jgi:TRAP-type transport system small permease protein
MTAITHRLQALVRLLLMFFLMAMVVLTFVDVVGRRVFDAPVFGAQDITEHLMAVIVFAGLPLLTAARAHLSIDLFDAWLLQPQWRWWHRAVDALIAAVLALIAWQYAVAAIEAVQLHEVSQALGIPRSWMYVLMSACCVLSALAAWTARVSSATAQESQS